MSKKIIHSLEIIALLGFAAALIRLGDPAALFERLFLVAVYLFFFFSYLLRMALLLLGIYAVYRTLWKLVNGPRLSQLSS